MIIYKNRGFKRKYPYGGAGIFDTIASFIAKLFTSNAAKQIASSALDIGKTVNKESAKKVLEVVKSAAADAGKKIVEKALMSKSQKILQKYTKPQQRDINTLIDGSAIAINDLVKNK